VATRAERAQPAAPSRARDRLRLFALIGAALSVLAALVVLGDSFSLGLSGDLVGTATEEEQQASNWLGVAGLALIVSSIVGICGITTRSYRLTAVAAGVQAVFALVALYWLRVGNSLGDVSARNDTVVYGIYGVTLLSAVLALVWAARAWTRARTPGQSRRL